MPHLNITRTWAHFLVASKWRKERNSIRCPLSSRVVWSLYFTLDGRTGSLHLGPCIRSLCAPHVGIVSFRHLQRHSAPTGGRHLYLASSPQFAAEAGIFAPKLGHGTYYFTSPPKEGMLRIFTHRKKSIGFGRDRTREVGNQRPAC
jgi:hypothetical protein